MQDFIYTSIYGQITVCLSVSVMAKSGKGGGGEEEENIALTQSIDGLMMDCWLFLAYMSIHTWIGWGICLCVFSLCIWNDSKAGTRQALESNYQTPETCKQG